MRYGEDWDTYRVVTATLTQPEQLPEGARSGGTRKVYIFHSMEKSSAYFRRECEAKEDHQSVSLHLLNRGPLPWEEESELERYFGHTMPANPAQWLEVAISPFGPREMPWDVLIPSHYWTNQGQTLANMLEDLDTEQEDGGPEWPEPLRP